MIMILTVDATHDMYLSQVMGVVHWSNLDIQYLPNAAHAKREYVLTDHSANLITRLLGQRARRLDCFGFHDPYSFERHPPSTETPTVHGGFHL